MNVSVRPRAVVSLPMKSSNAQISLPLASLARPAYERWWMLLFKTAPEEISLWLFFRLALLLVCCPSAWLPDCPTLAEGMRPGRSGAAQRNYLEVQAQREITGLESEPAR